MNTLTTRVAALALVALASAITGSVLAEENPLQPFEKLIGGKWELKGSAQEFEWGVGRKSVLSRSHFTVDGRSRKVSEGFWYWHPGSNEIRGVFVAVDMPVELFEYTTRFEGRKMISQLRSYTSEGDESLNTETFEFTTDGQYEWSLYDGGDETQAKVMSGTYVRK